MDITQSHFSNMSVLSLALNCIETFGLGQTGQYDTFKNALDHLGTITYL